GADHLQIATNAAPVFVQEDGRLVGVRYPRTGQDASRGRTVFLSFPLEAVPGEAPAPNNRATVLGNALEFLLPGLRGIASVAFDNNAYTLPSSVTVEVSDARRSGEARLEVALAAPAESQPVRVECFETPVRGIFRGRFTLVPTNTPAGNPPPLPGPGSLAAVRARHGDTFTARYVDSAGRAVVTGADVDTLAPRISGLAVEPAYNEAVVSWETDKPTDALVRFGESGGDDTFLTRTAYNAEFATSHAVLVRGLQPDRDYYYKVVSRDAAGNVVEDANGGRLHRLRTLKPLAAPWRDDLEAGRTGWAVYDDASVVGGGGGGIWDDEDDGGGLGFATASWEYGTPENARGVAARSGDKCWATNLRGRSVDLAASDLITPAVNLTGGNRARLRFWHYHDFTTPDAGGEDDGFGDFTLEAAQVAISTNDGATWTDLWFSQVETTDDWELVEIDISRFLGSVVRFRFNYQYFSFNTQARLGWFIDDVGVDLNIVPETAVWVTNNLHQATFTLAAGTNRWAGSGAAWRTNVPPGTYVVTWGPVPFQLTPPAQTNVVGTGTNATVFAGRYTQPDANANAVSDLWEQHFFGRLLATPAAADFDGDGASDLGEFLAGTSPTDPASVLRLEPPEELPNRTVRLRWTGQPGRQYLLEGGVSLGQWQPFSPPVRSAGGPLEVTLPALDNRLPYFFRLRVFP
ncbi:MAG: fibronectin type III domain-containing protein, partial [Verrucomicrobiota bacterium]